MKFTKNLNKFIESYDTKSIVTYNKDYHQYLTDIKILQGHNYKCNSIRTVIKDTIETIHELSNITKFHLFMFIIVNILIYRLFYRLFKIYPPTYIYYVYYITLSINYAMNIISLYRQYKSYNKIKSSYNTWINIYKTLYRDKIMHKKHIIKKGKDNIRLNVITLIM